MKALLQRVWKDVSAGKNVTVWLSLVAAAVIFVARLAGWVDDKWTAPFIVGAIGLCLYEFLRLRATVDELKGSSDLLSQELAKTRAALGVSSRAEVVSGFPELRDMYSRATSISILTVTCHQIFHEYRDVLTAHLDAGHPLRILTVDPSSQVFQNVVYFGETGNDVQRMADGLRDKLGVFATEWAGHAASGTFSIRAIEHAPPYRLILMKDKVGTRTAVVLPRPLQVTGKRFLAIILHDPDHSEWIAYLEKQFESLWAKAK